MATSSSLPSSPAAASNATPVAPPNFYAQAASAQPPAKPTPDNSEDTKKFRTAIEKLAGVEGIFTKMEKLKPNGKNIEKKVKAIAQSLKDLSTEVMEGSEGEDGGDQDTDLGDGKTAAGQTNAASPPPVAPGGAAGTGA